MKVARVRQLRVDGYGTYSKSVTDGLNQTMDNVVNGLNRAIGAINAQMLTERNIEIGAKLLTTVAPFLALIGAGVTSSGDAKAAVQSGLNTMKNIVARLNGPSRQEVLAGTMPTSKWMASAEEVAKGIQAQAKILNDDSIYGFVKTTMEAAYEAFANLGRAADNWLEKYKWPLLIGGGEILALLLYSQVVPQRVKVSVSPMSWFDPEQRDLE